MANLDEELHQMGLLDNPNPPSPSLDDQLRKLGLLGGGPREGAPSTLPVPATPKPSGSGSFWEKELLPMAGGMALSALPASYGMELGAALGAPFGPLGMLVGGAIGGGLAGGAMYRMGHSVLKGESPFTDLTPGGLAADAGVGLALGGVGYAGKAALNQFFRNRSGAILDKFGEDIPALRKILGPYLSRGKELQAEMAAGGVAKDVPHAWTPGSTDSEIVVKSNLWVPFRNLMASPYRTARAYGESLFMRKQAESLLNEWYNRQGARILGDLSSAQREAFDKEFFFLAKGSHYFNSTGDPVPFYESRDAGIRSAVSRYRETMKEAYDLKRDLGIYEKVQGPDISSMVDSEGIPLGVSDAATGSAAGAGKGEFSWEPIKEKPFYVIQTPNEELSQALEPRPGFWEFLSRSNKNSEEQVRRMLQEKGLNEATIQRVLGRQKARGMYEFQSGELPDDLYEHGYYKIWDRTAHRDVQELASAVAFGGGKPSMMHVGSLEFETPEIVKDSIELMRKDNHLVEAKMMENAIRRIYKQKLDPLQREGAFLRMISGNMALASNFWLQMSEIWKATAYSGGIGRYMRGRPIVKAMGPWLSAATGSDIESMVGEAAMKATPKFSPIWLSRFTDRASRRIMANGAAGMVDDVARTAHRMRLNGESWTGALLKEGEEIMSFSRGMGKEALTKLADEIQLNGSIAPENMLRYMGNLVGRWAYTWGPGMAPEVMQGGMGAIALQFRSFAVRAFGHFMDDIVYPMKDGFKLLATENDPTLLKLAVGRFMRAGGYQLAPAVAAAYARKIQQGKDDTNLWYIGSQMMGSTAGAGGDILSALLEEGLTGQGFRYEHMADIPLVSQTIGATGDIANMLFSGNIRRGARGINQVVKAAFPYWGLGPEGLINRALSKPSPDVTLR